MVSDFKIFVRKWSKIAAEKNCMGRGETHKHINIRTSRLLDRIGPVGRFDENCRRCISKLHATKNVIIEFTSDADADAEKNSIGME